MFLACLALLVRTAVGSDVTKITNAQDLIYLAGNVSKGKSYQGTTVFLDSDLDFSGKTFKPIGKEENNYFLGTFDGQGHTISNLEMNSPLHFVGLFGYSEGTAIKNVVIDSSCSFANSFVGSNNNIYLAGIIGYCYSKEGPCSIENSVNMASVTFNGNITGYRDHLYLGGTAGYLDSNSYGSVVKNCANYGSVAHLGESKYSYIGGVIGQSDGSSTAKTSIQNCFNHGDVIHTGSTPIDNLHIGGISGYNYYSVLGNCVNFGNITSNTDSSYIGSIGGYLSTSSSLSHCYWAKGLKFDACGHKYPFPQGTMSETSKFDDDFLLDKAVSIGDYSGTSLIEALNAYTKYYDLHEYSRWVLNRDGKDMTFKINNYNGFTLNSQIILLPILASEGKLWFNGWYNDNAYSTLFTGNEITGTTELYGKWEENTKEYTITFDTRGGATIEPITSRYFSVVALPSSSMREGICTVAFWENKYGEKVSWNFTVPAHSITLYAIWQCTRIATAENFIDFYMSVDKGVNFEGVTVFLDSDLDFSGKAFEPIGNENNYFLGTFDGQGYTISNLEMNSPLHFVGLFGYSEGTAIKNVVIGNSCSFVNSYIGSDDVYSGGLIGYCYAEYGPCNIENSVNMGNLIFNGTLSSYNDLYIGGIAGYLDSNSYNFVMKNCANYGSVTHPGESKYSYIGGIIGKSGGSSTAKTSIQNCLNHGNIIHTGKTTNLYMGGISGYTYSTNFENCVSFGNISLNTTSSYIGSVVGYFSSGSSISHCYWAESLKFDACGYNGYSSTTTEIAKIDNSLVLNETVSIGDYSGTSLIEALNAYTKYYDLHEYSRWLLNKDEKDATFKINNRQGFILNSPIILLPSLASEGKLWFNGWYSDTAYSGLFTGNEITGTTELHGKWEENTKEYTVSFDTRGKIPFDSITTPYSSVISLPKALSGNICTAAFWKNKYGERVSWNFTVPGHNITLYAVLFCTRIATVQDFIDFPIAVNSGEVHSKGVTVFLDSDIDLKGEVIEPIGNENNYFNGTFDGQGYTISNLNLSASNTYAGLFGYSEGATIRNLVIGESLPAGINGSSSGHSLRTTRGGANPVFFYMGEFIGYCEANDSPCIIENSVNMNNITFDGDSSYYLYLGGIAGYVSSSGFESSVKNCVNYGSITINSGYGHLYTGGIVGDSYYAHIQNSLSYGPIILDSKASYQVYLGGIVGYSTSSSIDNCVSAGIISVNVTSIFIGSIVGYFSSGSSISHCYWDESIGYDACGTVSASILSGIAKFDDEFVLNETVSIVDYSGTSLDEALNAAAGYYSLRDYSQWSLNKNKKDVAFNVNGVKMNFTLNSQIILLPSLASEGKLWFDGWYSDNAYSTPFTGNEITENTELYGKWEENTKEYTITFDTRGRSLINPITAPFGSVVALPSTSPRNGCSVGLWETEYEDNVAWNYIVLAHDVTLYAVWKSTHLITAEDLIEFSRNVNRGMNFLGETVFIDSDIDFSDELSRQFEPVGKDKANHFLGTFDGQGYTISNLVLNSSSFQFAGLFGYSGGATIKNVVLGDSCSFTSSYRTFGYTFYDHSFPSMERLYLGGIGGYCDSEEGPCLIENNVNMASVIFTGNTTNRGDLYLGGLFGNIGIIKSREYSSIVKNCANYGSVTHSGTNYCSYIGGIVGYSYGGSSNRILIQNCINYGRISFIGASSSLYIGGIGGYISYTVIENCVSAGVISSNTTRDIGSIVGYVYSSTSLLHSFWASDVEYSSSFGSGTPSIEDDVSQVKLNITVMNKLNDYASSNSWNKWLLNDNSASVSFRINNGKGFSLYSQLILLHDPADNNERSFNGWYNDELLTSPFMGSEVESDATLYGLFCGSNYTVSLDVNGGDELDINEIIFECNGTYGTLPTPVRAEAVFDGWFTERVGGYKVESNSRVTILRNHALYAHWTVNQYSIKFIRGNGVDPEVRVFEFNASIDYPSIPTRDGYTFNGWDKIISLMPAENVTITAQWAINKYTITFIFDNGVDPEMRAFEPNASIDYPNVPVKDGYTFNGWDKIISLMPAENVTIAAQWIDKPTQYVEIVFSRVDLKEGEAAEIIKAYTSEEFTIEGFEVDDSTGESVLIIRFTDVAKSEEFVRSINGNRRGAADNFIRRVNGVERKNSFSFISIPLSLIFNLIII